jgi:alginate O-acetyltransferase complex protein AlgI
MIFTTGIFGLFLALSLAVYWLAPSRLRRYVLIVAGIIFYSYYFPRYLVLIGGLTLATYLVARAMLKVRGDGGDAGGHTGGNPGNPAYAGDPAGPGDSGDAGAANPGDASAGDAISGGKNENGPAGGHPGNRGGGSGMSAGRDPARRVRRWLVLGVALSLLVLGFFKYWKMAVGTVNSISAYLDWGINIPVPQILVPLGISFFTFEFIHFLSDIYLKKIRPESVNLADFTLFAFFYPTLVCGPIKRYQSFQEQTAALPSFEPEAFFQGAYRVVLGLAKKFIIADTVGRLSACLATPETTGAGMLVLGAYAYAVKIYFDFAGYSDIAIGISRMFGYRVPENFDRPYLQPNIALFWRHWHMSLSNWIRDYLYIPLGGSRRGLPRTLINLVVAFTLCGLWHGAAWNFVAWGAWHGFGLAGYRLWQRFKGSAFSRDNMVTRAISTLITFHFVTAGWILFAAPSLGKALATFQKIF